MGPKKNKGGQADHADTNRESYQPSAEWESQRLFARRDVARVKATRHKALGDIVLQPQVVKVLIESERQWCGPCHQEEVARISVEDCLRLW